MVSLREIREARQTLSGVVHHTPLVQSRTFSELTGCTIFLKTENLQRTGSFKLRGAYCKLSSLTANQRQKGVIAASAGNHAQGVAVAAQASGVTATVVMPETASLAKITATRNYGAHIVLHGQTYDEAFEHAIKLQRESHAVFIHPFDDPRIIAGQGTIALEIVADLPEVDALIVPVGGGGLIAGMAVAAKETRPETNVIGVQASAVPAAYDSFKSGAQQCATGGSTIADGIAVKCPGTLALEHIHHYVDDIVLVEDEDISQTMVMLLERAKMVVEGAGAVALAALLCGRLKFPGKRVAAILSGGNVDVNLLARIIEHGLTKAGRYLMLRTYLVDQPGQLHRLTEVLAGLRVNILDIQHRRAGVQLPLNQAEVDLTLETRDVLHGKEILVALEANGYVVTRL